MTENNDTMKGRFARYMAISGLVTLLAYEGRTLLGIVLSRYGAEVVAGTLVYAQMCINLLAAIVTATLTRRYVFRSALAWWLAVPLMVLLELLFDGLTGMLWQPVFRILIDHWQGMTTGEILQAISMTFNLTQFVLWTVLAYWFQRFVLYRNTLDAAVCGSEEEAYERG